jgi:hypothetical protein
VRTVRLAPEWLAVVALVCVGLANEACPSTPPILAPTYDSQGCNVETEHDCAGGGCCLANWTCGGQQQDVFVTCAKDECCDEEDNPDLPGARRLRKMPKRRIKP